MRRVGALVQVDLIRAAAIATACLTVGMPLAAQRRSTFSVGVAEASSGTPIPGAEVLLPELKLIARTDSLGHATITGVVEGDHRVRVRRLGFVASEIRLQFQSDTTDAVFRLEASAATLSTVDVKSDAVPTRLADFEIRRKQGFGRFLTEGDLAKDATRDFTDVATVRFPGLAVRTDEFGKPHVASVRSNCGSGGGALGNPRGAGGVNGRIIADRLALERRWWRRRWQYHSGFVRIDAPMFRSGSSR